MSERTFRDWIDDVVVVPVREGETTQGALRARCGVVARVRGWWRALPVVTRDALDMTAAATCAVLIVAVVWWAL